MKLFCFFFVFSFDTNSSLVLFIQCHLDDNRPILIIYLRRLLKKNDLTYKFRKLKDAKKYKIE